MPATQVAETLALQLKGLKSFYLGEIISEFRGLESYASSSINVWRGKVVPLVKEAQATAAELTNAAVDIMFYEMFGEDCLFDHPALEAVTGPAIRNGPSVQDVYDRALKPVWQGLGSGQSLDQSVEHGVSRLEEMFNLDIERVADHVQIERFANENRIIGHRRTLSGLHNCALCILASTQLYHKSELKPIHPNCKCRTVPVLSSDKFDDSLSQSLIDAVHRSVSERFGVSDKAARLIDYRKILLNRTHGEYGPVLTFRSHKFTGPSALHAPGE